MDEEQRTRLVARLGEQAADELKAMTHDFPTGEQIEAMARVRGLDPAVLGGVLEDMLIGGYEVRVAAKHAHSWERLHGIIAAVSGMAAGLGAIVVAPWMAPPIGKMAKPPTKLHDRTREQERRIRQQARAARSRAPSGRLTLDR